MKSKTTRRIRRRRNVKRTKTKRGGMYRTAISRARSTMGTTLYNQVLPLFTAYKDHIGQNPTPEQNALVREGERYFKTVGDIPADDPLKASITELMKEWTNTPKKAEKTLGLYNKLLLTLKNAEIRRKQQLAKDDALKRPSIVTDTFSSNPNSLTSSPLVLRGTSYTPHASSSSSPFADTPQSLTHPNFQTPSKLPQYSTLLETPPKLNPDEKAPQSIDPGDLYVQGTRLFLNPENTTPLTSPDKFASPPHLPSKSRLPLSPLSPSRRLVLG